MKRFLLLFWVIFTALSAHAQPWVDIGLSVRADYQRDWNHDDAEDTGFRGKYLNLDINGKISDHLYYSLRQRLNKAPTSANPLNATDWVNLTFRKDNWSVSAGKLVLEMGGYEYYNAPIDIYFASQFWNNIACYQYGVSGVYTTRRGNHHLLAQITQSPYANFSEDWFSYNLLWSGQMGLFSTRYSVNFAQMDGGKYVNHIILGNRFDCGKLKIEADFYHRASLDDFSFCKNFTVVGKVVYSVSDYISLFGKISYDVNKEIVAYDAGLFPGTEYTRYGAGIEIFPINQKMNYS